MLQGRVGRITLVVTVVSVALFLVRCPPPPGEVQIIMLPGGVPLEMLWIPSGSFMMGRYPDEWRSSSTEDPQHLVELTGFWLGKYEVTKAQWEAVMGTRPWIPEVDVLDDPDSPATHMSGYQTQDFITALSEHTGLTLRLPSESEWEYACRAGTTTRYYWGDDLDDSVDGRCIPEGEAYLWYVCNALDADEYYAHVVGQKLPNAWGLYDMSGNVWERVQDEWHNDYVGAPKDGSAWIDSLYETDRVARGGGWDYPSRHVRSATRGPFNWGSPGRSLGFRLAR